VETDGKIKIKDKCQIINREYQIVFSKDMLRAAEARAQADHVMQVIRLAHLRPDVQKFEHLIHEILESIQDCLSLDFSHETIIAISPVIAQALMSLGIVIDFSQIPREILEVEPSA